MAEQWNTETMERRVARYKKLRAVPMTFLDAALPEHEREILNVIGAGVSENRDADSGAIRDVSYFNIQMARCLPGRGAGLHGHETVEVFFAASGKWEVYFGDNGEHVITLDTFDTISVPPGIFRGFRNISDKEALLVAVVGAEDPGVLTWAPSLHAKVRERGFDLDGDNKIISSRDR
jgi:uncharacterized RmlC-like cupin family protein